MVRAFRSEEVAQCGDEEYTLAIDITIIDALEDEFDLPFDDLMAQFEKSARIGKLARLLRGLLSRHHPELGLDEIGGLLLEYNDAFGLAMQRLFEKATPDKKKAKGENPPKARRGTGGSSSSHGARTTAGRRATSGSKRLEHSS